MPDTAEGLGVRGFYNDAKILITGGTGFLGKTLVDKLLRVFPKVDRIYLLIRVKKGKDPTARLKEVFENAIFNTLRKENPDFEKKVTCIPGEISGPNLSLSESDYELLRNEVTHVFHCAATVRFNEKLKIAIDINVHGTQEILKFCKKCINLKVQDVDFQNEESVLVRRNSALHSENVPLKCNVGLVAIFRFTNQVLVHVSTAYAFCPSHVVAEKIYEPPLTGENALGLAKILSDEQLEAITPNLLGSWPNSYSFTKSIAESLVKECSNFFPISIVRPSIVMGTAREPIEGWVDNIYGATGIILGVGAGVIRVLYVDSKQTANLVPVDLTVNLMIASAWEVATNWNNGNTIKNSLGNVGSDESANKAECQNLKIYNFTASNDNSLSWYDFLKISVKHGHTIPPLKAIWYFSIMLTRFKFLYYFLIVFLHYIPAVICDLGLLLVGKKPSMWKTYQKIHLFTKMISVYAIEKWHYTDDNVRKLSSRLSKEDQRLFDFDMSKLDWSEYLFSVINGVRIHILQESDSVLPAARRKQFLLWLCHRFIQICLVAFCFWILRKMFFTYDDWKTPIEQSFIKEQNFIKNSS